MPTFEITAPDGKAYHVEGDNQEGAVNALHQMLGGAGAVEAAVPAPAAPIHIGAPDGSIVQFPAGTSDDTINTAMRKAYPAPGKTTLNIEGRNVSVNTSALVRPRHLPNVSLQSFDPLPQGQKDRICQGIARRPRRTLN
jgi:hypothetical protein